MENVNATGTDPRSPLFDPRTPFPDPHTPPFNARTPLLKNGIPGLFIAH